MLSHAVRPGELKTIYVANMLNMFIYAEGRTLCPESRAVPSLSWQATLPLYATGMVPQCITPGPGSARAAFVKLVIWL